MQSKSTWSSAQAKSANAHQLLKGACVRTFPSSTSLIPLVALPTISKAIAKLPHEDARALKFLMLSAARPTEMLELQLEGIQGAAWRPYFEPMFKASRRQPPLRPLSGAAAHLVQLALGTAVGVDRRGQVFRTARGAKFSSEQILRRLRAIDRGLQGRSFRLTFAVWAANTHSGLHTRLALGQPTFADRQVFAKFGAQSYLAAMAGARQLMDDWALVCQ